MAQAEQLAGIPELLLLGGIDAFEYSGDGFVVAGCGPDSHVEKGETRGAESLVMHVAPRTTPPGVAIEWPDVRGCLPSIESALGAPVYRDERIVVYPLKPERRSVR